MGYPARLTHSTRSTRILVERRTGRDQLKGGRSCVRPLMEQVRSAIVHAIDDGIISIVDETPLMTRMLARKREDFAGPRPESQRG